MTPRMTTTPSFASRRSGCWTSTPRADATACSRWSSIPIRTSRPRRRRAGWESPASRRRRPGWPSSSATATPRSGAPPWRRSRWPRPIARRSWRRGSSATPLPRSARPHSSNSRRLPSDRNLQPVIDALRDPDPAVRLAAGRALGSAPGSHVEEVLSALGRTGDDGRRDRGGQAPRARRPPRSGAGVRPLGVSPGDRRPGPRRGGPGRRRRQLRSSATRSSTGAATVARSALWAATTLVARRVEMATAIEHLDGPPPQLANALETLETAGDPALVRPLLALWEAAAVSRGGVDWLALALEDDDELIRRCAEFIRAEREGGSVPDSVTALSVIERVLFLRKVSLFSELAPPDLERLALVVEERGYGDGEVIADQGEMGEELHIVVVRRHSGRPGAAGVGCPAGPTDRGRGRRRDVAHHADPADGDARGRRCGPDDPGRPARVRQHPSRTAGVALAVMRVLAERLQEAGLHVDRTDPSPA